MGSAPTPLPAPVPLDAIRSARERLAGVAVRTPLVRLEVDGPARVWLKLECLQPVGSFKVRCAGNAMLAAEAEALREGVCTASAGNMAQGVAWMARRLGIPCDIVVPEHAPQAKLDAIERLGGRVRKLPFDDWWRTFDEDGWPGMSGYFVNPVLDADVVAGNATIGLEIAEDLPDVEAVLVPFGGGALSGGIGSALRHVSPRTRVYGCEPETAAPLAASLAAGGPRSVAYTPTFVDGAGGKSVYARMWPLASTVLAGAITVGIAETAAAIRLLVERTKVVAEGAGALSVAAALRGRAPDGSPLRGDVVCVVSGGHIDPAKLARILAGEVP